MNILKSLNRPRFQEILFLKEKLKFLFSLYRTTKNTICYITKKTIPNKGNLYISLVRNIAQIQLLIVEWNKVFFTSTKFSPLIQNSIRIKYRDYNPVKIQFLKESSKI